MGRRIRRALGRAARAAALAGPLLAAARARAEGEEAVPAPKWYEEISVDGFVSASFSYNFNRPASGTNQYRVFDFDDGSIRLDVAELVVRKDAAKPGETGFRADAVAGASIPRVSAASGLFRDPETGEAGDFDLQQAFVTWIAPVGSGLRLDVGKFTTTIGYELIEGFDGWNDNATRSFLFGYAQPATHTGLKAGYAFSEKLSANLLLVNGWDNVKDGNSSKTVGAGVTLAPGPGLSLTVNGLYGPERSGNDTDARAILDVVAVAKASDAVTVAFNLDWGNEDGAAPGGGSATWWGVAGYVRWSATPAFALVLRAEHFDDADGVRTGTAQKLEELTLTPEVRVGTRLVFRADLRVDFSDTEVFEDSDGALTKRRQPPVLLNALYAF